eukprot:19112-Heterococcus_DN1.PRE.5
MSYAMSASVAVPTSLLHKCYKSKRIHSVLCHSAVLTKLQRVHTPTLTHVHAHCIICAHTLAHTTVHVQQRYSMLCTPEAVEARSVTLR